MKKILTSTASLISVVAISLAIFVFVSCGPSREELEIEKAKLEANGKYKLGDIIYLKPDNCKAVIISFDCDYDYEKGLAVAGYYVRDCHGQHLTVQDHLIYGTTPGRE